MVFSPCRRAQPHDHAPQNEVDFLQVERHMKTNTATQSEFPVDISYHKIFYAFS